MFCPACGNNHLNQFENNRPVADFYCVSCSEQYEVKSKKGPLGKKIVNGAYDKMIERINSQNNPNLLMLSYSPDYQKIITLLAIPAYYFSVKVIEKRKPLSSKAKRAGWTGCNILINEIPHSGKIDIVIDDRIIPKDEVLFNWQKTAFLQDEKFTNRGWLLETLRILDKLESPYFSLSEVYEFEQELKKIFPNNKNIKAKIRQQLQLLRDKKFIQFLGRGRYKKCT